MPDLRRVSLKQADDYQWEPQTLLNLARTKVLASQMVNQGICVFAKQLSLDSSPAWQDDSFYNVKPWPQSDRQDCGTEH